MKPNIVQTVLKITAGDSKNFPKDKLCEVALSGRSNVGKSSLINSLIRRNNYARVSSTPGKTITINFYEVDKKMYIVDLPGYGFAKRPPEDKAKWSRLTDGYFTKGAENLSCVAQLVDLKVGITSDDALMIDYMNRCGLDYFIVATKTDKLNKTDREKALSDLENNQVIRKGTEIIPFSAKSGEGRETVINKIFSYLK